MGRTVGVKKDIRTRACPLILRLISIAIPRAMAMLRGTVHME